MYISSRCLGESDKFYFRATWWVFDFEIVVSQQQSVLIASHPRTPGTEEISYNTHVVVADTFKPSAPVTLDYLLCCIQLIWRIHRLWETFHLIGQGSMVGGSVMEVNLGSKVVIYGSWGADWTIEIKLTRR